MTAKEFYNSKAIKHQLKRAIKHDKAYFESAIIELMEQYAQSQVNKNGICQDIGNSGFRLDGLIPCSDCGHRHYIEERTPRSDFANGGCPKCGCTRF